MININKVVILAGGKGTRISEETQTKPKPLVEIGGKPIIHHIMKIYSFYGIKKFYILVGYKSLDIKNYFIKELYSYSDIQVNLKDGSIKKIKNKSLDWEINIIETGEDSMTGGRLLTAKKYLEKDENFFMTYADCLSDINLKKLYKCHIESKKIATVTGIIQNNRFGAITIDGNKVKSFSEKPIAKNTLISGGFFVFNSKIFNYLKNKKTVLEKDPLSNLAKNKELNCYVHKSFWHPMDNLREKNSLEEMWQNNKAPWKKFF